MPGRRTNIFLAESDRSSDHFQGKPTEISPSLRRAVGLSSECLLLGDYAVDLMYLHRLGYFQLS